MAPWTHTDVPPLGGKTAVVTGANSGIGLETARALARRGARVVLACRSARRGQAAIDDIKKTQPEAAVELEPLDLGDLASVHSFADTFQDRFSSLDILCNNAGIMVPPRGKTADGFETQFGTNHLGHFALTGRLLDALKNAPGARVVTLSSLAHRTSRIDFDNLNAERGYSRSGAYGQSKLANLLFSYELERRFEAARVDAISVGAHPGWTATNLQAHTRTLRFLNHFFAQGPPDGALPSLYAATAPDAAGGEYYGPGGPFQLTGSPKRVRSSARSYELPSARRLWTVSEDLTGITFAL